MQCKFTVAWVGQCKEEAVEGQDYCQEHLKARCSCGAQATHTCDATMGLVCGANLCNDCEHELDEKGTNGFHTRHCKKSEQNYHSWWVQECIKRNQEEFNTTLTKLKSATPLQQEKFVMDLIIFKQSSDRYAEEAKDYFAQMSKLTKQLEEVSRREAHHHQG
jgi:hypothetical protein